MGPPSPLSLPGICLLLLIASAKGQTVPESLLETAPAPDWVEVIDIAPPDDRPHADLANGEYYLDVEMQWHLPTKTRFYRTVVQILNESGLEANGQWTFTFDPLFETQRIHWVRIIRDGRVISTYDLRELRLYNTESDMPSRLLNGSLTALVVLEDLRVGDIVDVASSVQGANPAFGEEAVLRRQLDWSVPVHRQLNRILAAPDQPLRMESFLGEPLREVTDTETDVREWRHEVFNKMPVSGEPAVPAAVRVFGELQVSTFADWTAVADWAAALYPGEPDLPADLRAEAARIRSMTGDPKKRAKAALAHVQSTIRYLGLEMGHGAYTPRPPELVWQRRFGDCKDKSLLLAQMLRELGIDACPALVNTAWQAGIADFLPSPLAFNHVIVTAEIDGVPYWLDPTHGPRAGPLDALPVDPYGYALLVREGETSLTPVAPHPRYRNFISVETKLHVARPGEESTMTVISRYGGNAAAATQRYFENTARNEVGQSYSTYWASTYARPELLSPVEYEEFPDSGEVETREYYRIPDAWIPSDDGDDPLLYFSFAARSLVDSLVFPDRIERRFPYAIGDPISIVEQFEVRLFEPWDLEPDAKAISGPGVRYSTSTTWGPVVKARFEFQRTRSSIEPGEVPEFETVMQRINNDSNWELSWDPRFAAAPGAADMESAEFDNAIAFLLLGCGVLLAVLFFVPFLFKKRLEPPRVIPPGCEDYEGVKGWLILPVIGLIATPFVVLAGLSDESLIWIFSQSQWDGVVQTKGAAMILLVGVECVLFGFIMAAPVFLLILLFQRRRFFPALMIGLYGFQILFILFSYVSLNVLQAEQASPEDFIREDLKTTLMLLLWLCYFKVSKRVKATFRF